MQIHAVQAIMQEICLNQASQSTRRKLYMSTWKPITCTTTGVEKQSHLVLVLRWVSIASVLVSWGYIHPWDGQVLVDEAGG